MLKKGFTLVEVMIVVGVIALLATIIIPNALKARMSANDVMAQSTLKTIATALENYLAANGNYPPASESLTNITPPYLNRDYFNGVYSGFSFSAGLDDFTYTITATPVDVGRTGTTTYSIVTGGIFQGS